MSIVIVASFPPLLSVLSRLLLANMLGVVYIKRILVNFHKRFMVKKIQIGSILWSSKLTLFISS